MFRLNDSKEFSELLNFERLIYRSHPLFDHQIQKADLEKIVGEVSIYIGQDDKPIAPGMLIKHYSPKTKTVLLENDVRLEDGKLLNPRHQEKIDQCLINNINDSIEYVLRPEIRKMYKRKEKLERIVKDI